MSDYLQTDEEADAEEDFWEEDNFDDEAWCDPYEYCTCPYCYCMNKTLYGEVCSECQSGAHQG